MVIIVTSSDYLCTQITQANYLRAYKYLPFNMVVLHYHLDSHELPQIDKFYDS